MYSIKILTDSEFESLPYPDMENTLGVADPEIKTAFVRHTGIDDLDRHLINHELEHLIEGHGGKHSDHYRNGVYYKGFGEIMSSVGQVAGPIMMAIPGLQPVGIATTAAAGAGGMMGQKRAQKKSMNQMGQMGGGMAAPQSPMEGFDIQTPEAPAQPNIITPGGAGGGGMDEGGVNSGSAIDRVKGFFSGRNPVGGF